MAEKLKVELQDENGNIYYLHTDASVVFCEDGKTVESKLALTVNESDIVNNATTAATDKVVSAAVAKNLQDQITKLNTNTLEALTLTSSGNLSPRGMQYIAYDNLWARIHLCFAVSIDVPANSAICTLPITVQTINNIGCVSSDGTVYPFRFESDKIYTVNSLTVGKLIEINLTVAR